MAAQPDRAIARARRQAGSDRGKRDIGGAPVTSARLLRILREETRQELHNVGSILQAHLAHVSKRFAFLGIKRRELQGTEVASQPEERLLPGVLVCPVSRHRMLRCLLPRAVIPIA